MSLNDAAKARLKQGSEAITHVGGSLLNVGFAYFDWRGRVRDGQNPVVAGAVAAGNAFLGATMGVLPYMAVTAGPGLVKNGLQAYYSYYQGYTAYTRRMTQPFSHTFSHTDATYQLQQRGIAAINGGRGAIGSEAGMMAQLYGRR